MSSVFVESMAEEGAKVQITEESTTPAAEEVQTNPTEISTTLKAEEVQISPIVEEPKSATIPQIIPETNSSGENTVITEITANETPEYIFANTPIEDSPLNNPHYVFANSPIKDSPLNNPKLKKGVLKITAKMEYDPTSKPTMIRAEGAPDLPPDANTVFILDLMLQKQEKLRRKKKDDKILEMALKMKKEKEDAKKGKRLPSYSYGSGGFLGVGQLTKSHDGKSPQLHRKAVTDEFAAVPSDGESRVMFEN